MNQIKTLKPFFAGAAIGLGLVVGIEYFSARAAIVSTLGTSHSLAGMAVKECVVNRLALHQVNIDFFGDDKSPEDTMVDAFKTMVNCHQLNRG